MFNSWVFCVIVFIVLQVGFLQLFKLAARKSNNIGALTVLVQLLSALFALALSPIFKWQWPDDWKVWLFLGIALVFYAAADRLNAAARKNMEISVESMLHQVWKLLFFVSGIIFLGRSFSVLKLMGGIIIVLANMSLFFEEGKFRINKYTILKLIAIVCFTVAMTLDVYNSDYFNLPFYVFLSFAVPAVMLLLAGQASPKKIWSEISSGKLLVILLCAFCNGIGAVMILRAYQIEYFMAAAISSVYVLLNVAFAFVFLKERRNLGQKLIAAAIIVCSIVIISLA